MLMTKEISVGLFNYENGGRKKDGTYDFSKLRQAFDTVEEAPDLLLINEAKGWKANGNTLLHTAVNALAQRLEKPYVGEIGCGIRGDATTPALIYDPTRLRLESWGNDSVDNDDKRNTGTLHISGDPSAKFRVAIRHFDYVDGSARTAEAHQTKGLATGLPTLLGGDLNNSASGPYHPDTDWTTAREDLRRTKARMLEDGSFAADTTAMDLMLGDWDYETRQRSPYVRALGKASIGWLALAELAHQSGTSPEEAFKSSVNPKPGEAELLIDWLLINKAWESKGGLVPGTYHVHEPTTAIPEEYPSDHRLITATLKL